MGKRESYEPGTFCWVDLTTTNAEGAKAFYGDLFGWEFMDDEIPGGIYTMRHGDVATRLPSGSLTSWSPRATPLWRRRGLGGTVLAGPLDLPSGKIAVLGDLQGAAFAIFEGETDE